MKICGKCGAYNSDDRQFCVDCSEKLGKAISNEENDIIEENINHKVEKLYNKTDPLYVSVFDKTCGIISAVALVDIIIICIVGSVVGYSFKGIVGFGLLFSLLSIQEAFIPKLTWELEKLRLSMTIRNADESEPNSFYRISRKVSLFILTGLAILFLSLAIREIIHPDVVGYIDDLTRYNSNETYLLTGEIDADKLISNNPKKWKIIINKKDYTVNTFLNELENSYLTGNDECLMIRAITEITDVGKNKKFDSKESFLSYFYNNSDYKPKEKPKIT